jgi:hypothetical protein
MNYWTKIIIILSAMAMLSAQSYGKGDGNVAKVMLVKGTVYSEKGGKKVKLKKDDSVKEGAVITTGAKSFVRFLFIDKSKMNLGAKSEMKIKSFPRDKAGIINLIKGKVRATVSKNYMDIPKSKSKLFIKTRTAAMGVRGTDFSVAYNPQNSQTSLVTFEGTVAMVKVDSMINSVNRNGIDSMLNSPKAVKVKKGQYSGAGPARKRATIPVKISPNQLESMKKSDDQASNSDKDGKDGKKLAPKKSLAKRSLVPPGVNAKNFATSADIVEKQIEGSVGKEKMENIVSNTNQKLADEKREAPPPEGFANKATGAYAPPAGGFIDEKTGLYVPPPPGSAYDANAGVYIPPPNMGSFDISTGEYRPPEGFELKENGKFVQVDMPKRGPASVDNGPRERRDGFADSGEGPFGPGPTDLQFDKDFVLVDGGDGAEFDDIARRDDHILDNEDLIDEIDDARNERDNAPPDIINTGRSRTSFRISIGN